jgi:ADP-ribose pyrophosphatase YjhB (NUDIX family)
MSPQRIDYCDSPEAPRANSLVPAVNVVVVNDAGEILLIRRADNGNWAVPGGAVDLGESVAQAAVRETLEESGIECAITGIVGIYSDPSAGLRGQPGTGSRTLAPTANERGKAQKNSDLTSDYGISFRQTQRDHLELS